MPPGSPAAEAVIVGKRMPKKSVSLFRKGNLAAKPSSLQAGISNLRVARALRSFDLGRRSDQEGAEHQIPILSGFCAVCLLTSGSQ